MTSEPSPQSEEQVFDQALRNCDLEYARVTLIETFAGSVLKKDIAALLTRFISAPTDDNARALLRRDPTFMVAFTNNRDAKAFRQTAGIDVSRPRLTAAMLRLEPDFGSLVEAFVGDRAEFLRLKAEFAARGYDDDTIHASLSRYFENLAD